MDGLDNIIYMLDEILNTRRKRHITGGILVSMSLLFGGLAFTVMTIKEDLLEESKQNNKEDYNYE